MRIVMGLILGGLIGFGVALWYQGEPPFAGKVEQRPADIALVLSDAYLTRRIAPVITEQSKGFVHGVHVTSNAGDVVYVQGYVRPMGVTVPVGVTLRLRAAGNTVGVDILVAHIGPVPIPGVLTRPLQDVVNDRIAAVTSGQSFTVRSVSTTSSGVQVLLAQR
jgi:hypothetical protein